MELTNQIIPALSTGIAAGMLRKDLEPQLVNEITYAAMYSGFKKTDYDKAFEASELAAEIKRLFPTLRVGEIKIYFNNGLRGEYGEFMGLSVKTYVNWLKSGVKSEERHLAIKNEHMKRLPEKTEPTDEEKEKIFTEAFEFSFLHFQKTSQTVDGIKMPGIIIDQGNAIFDGLKKRGKIKISDEKFNQFIQSELFNITGKMSLRINQKAVTREEHSEKKILEQKIESLNENSPEIIAAAKNEILKQFYLKFKW